MFSVQRVFFVAPDLQCKSHTIPYRMQNLLLIYKADGTTLTKFYILVFTDNEKDFIPIFCLTYY